MVSSFAQKLHYVGTSRLSSQKKMIENIIHTYQYTYALQWRNIYFCKMHNTKRGADKKMKSGGGKKKIFSKSAKKLYKNCCLQNY